MLIWGNKTKSEARGFVLKGCSFCGTDQPHFVIEAKTKFTLYFVPTITYSKKALLVCTQCEREEVFEGQLAQGFLTAAIPRELMVALLRRGQPPDAAADESSGAARELSPYRRMAVGMVALTTQVALADEKIDEAEATAITEGFATIYSATKSEPVRLATALVVAELGELLEWIKAPVSGPVTVMLAEAGRVVRQLDSADQSRFVGQLAWLCDTVIATHNPTGGPELDQMEAGLAALGYHHAEVAASLAFCDRNGG